MIGIRNKTSPKAQSVAYLRGGLFLCEGIMKFKIDSEFEKLLPELCKNEYHLLEADILKNGLIDPVVIWKEEGILIDGHHRYKVCQANNIEITTFKNISFDNRDQAFEWVLEHAQGRRNLTPDQLRKVRGQLYELRKKAIGGRADRDLWGAQNEHPKTADVIAEDFGVSQATIRRDAAFYRELKADPKLEAVVDAGGSAKEYLKEKKAKERQEKKESFREAGEKYKGKHKIIHADFRSFSKTISNNSIDLIITDPPYPKEFLTLWGEMFEIAKRVLKPNAFLVAYSGQQYLPQIFKMAMNAGIDYYWTMALRFTKKPLVFGRKVLNEWKPILIFQNGFKIKEEVFSDSILMEYSERELHDENWGQTVAPFEWLLDKFSQPGDTVFDPFLGTGTTLLACENIGRLGIGTDIERKYTDLAKGRLCEIGGIIE